LPRARGAHVTPSGTYDFGRVTRPVISAALE
jgi:hypothetical protein